MVKRTEPYRLWVEPDVHAARESLPGNIRQRVKRIINGLPIDPCPANSRTLDTEGLDIPKNIEIRRVRLEKWRILYAVNETGGWVWVLEIRKRPPYRYEDLPEIAARLS